MRQYLTVLNPFYTVAVQARIYLYHIGLLKRVQSSLPCICIGNLTVGGTGKTPMVDYVVKLVDAMGYKAGIVSRGYKRSGSANDCLLVSKGDGQPPVSVKLAGDEPSVLAMRNPHTAIAVCARREEAIELLKDEGLANVIIMDDGFQHIGLERDGDVVLVDATRPLAAQKMLPAGDLREPFSGLKRATLIIHTKVDSPGQKNYADDNYEFVASVTPFIPQFKARYQVIDGYDGNGVYVTLSSLATKRVLALSGIAHPETFCSLIETVAGTTNAVMWPDHVEVGRDKVDAVLACCKRDKVDVVTTTEKDWVKIRPLLTKEERGMFCILTQTIELDRESEFIEDLEKIIIRAIEGRKIRKP